MNNSLKLVFILMLLSFTAGAQFSNFRPNPNDGWVFSVQFSPNVNQSEFTRNDTNTVTSYTGSRFNLQAGYRIHKYSLIGNIEQSYMEDKNDKNNEREDTNYGLTFRYTPIEYFFLQSTYWITNSSLSTPNQPEEEFSGNKLTAGVGLRIPVPGGAFFTVNADYIIDSQMEKDGAGGANVIDEEGYSISFGGALRYTY